MSQSPAPNLNRRLWLILAMVALVIALALFEFTAWVVGALSACDGDGGVPYSAHDSPAGRFCAALDEPGLSRIAWWVALLLPCVVLVVVGIIAIVRRNRRLLIVAAVGAFLLACGIMLPFFVLPSRCSTEQQRAYDEWQRAPKRTREPPFDCEHY